MISLSDVLGVVLPATMTKRGVSQRQLARELSVHESTLSRWIAGKLRPSSNELLRITKQLGYTLYFDNGGCRLEIVP